MHRSVQYTTFQRVWSPPEKILAHSQYSQSFLFTNNHIVFIQRERRLPWCSSGDLSPNWSQWCLFCELSPIQPDYLVAWIQRVTSKLAGKKGAQIKRKLTKTKSDKKRHPQKIAWATGWSHETWNSISKKGDQPETRSKRRHRIEIKKKVTIVLVLYE